MLLAGLGTNDLADLAYPRDASTGKCKNDYVLCN
jgi:hypothetical protein